MEKATLEEINEMLSLAANESQHSGLYNVHRRIQLMYGQDYGLSISSEIEIGTLVKILLPFHTEA